MPFRPFVASDTDALQRATALAFGFPADDALRWWDTAGRHNLRVLERDGLAGALLDIPMGLWVGGRSVRMHGVAGVVVPPERRREGNGRRLMADYLRELADRGVPLSTLYASTQTLYRSVGYGLAGVHQRAELPTAALRRAGDVVSGWVPLEETHREGVRAAWARMARHRTGHADRGDYLWARVWSHRGEPNQGWVWLDDDGLPRAWVVLRQERGDGDWLTLHLVDHGAVDASGLRAVAGFVGGFASMARRTRLTLGAQAPLLDLLPEHEADVRLVEPWMLRVVDVKAALTSRGWPEGLSTELHLQVDDPLLPANQGRWLLRVHGGEATVERGGSGTVAMSIEGLAGLYTGHTSPFALALRGQLQGEEPALRALGHAFAGPAPGMPDFF